MTGQVREWRLKGIRKDYGKKRALQRVSLTLRPGIYALLGPNGAGKSTLMNILAGVLKPSGGTVLVDGARLPRKEYQSYIGYLPQQFGCYETFSGLDMLFYVAALKGLPFDQKLEKQIGDAVRLFELERDIDRKIREYSGGMKQRLGIIQAFLGSPSLIILDEPTAGLDPKQRLYFKQMLEQAGEEKTILLSTHILADVEELADTILILKEGKLVSRIPNNEHVEEVYMEYFGKEAE